jgi:hypothetical protein
LGWAKNASDGTAIALDGYTLDAQSTSFLSAEFQTALTTGSYTGHFQYDQAIGWQTAIVGLKPPATLPPPVITSTPNNPTNQTSASFSFTDAGTGVSFLCEIDSNAFAACTSPATYTGLGEGSHTFSVKVQDGGGNQSSPTSFSWTIDTTPPPVPLITSTPNNPTNQTSATFKFSDSETGASFLCQLDGNTFSACSNHAT